uniref:Uncharacterized protein n=1 Tax=Anopheles darlingi TaxID=43151 RepID=A0A2M4DHQ0_ANODA
MSHFTSLWPPLLVLTHVVTLEARAVVLHLALSSLLAACVVLATACYSTRFLRRFCAKATVRTSARPSLRIIFT